jgi:hypothetical protein
VCVGILGKNEIIVVLNLNVCWNYFNSISTSISISTSTSPSGLLVKFFDDHLIHDIHQYTV